MANEVTEMSVNQIDDMLSKNKKASSNASLPNNTEGAKTSAKGKKQNKSSIQDKINQYQKKVKDAEREVYGYIDTAMATLEKLPEYIDVGMDLLSSNSFTFSLSPLALLLDLLNTIGVSDEEIKKWLVNFLVEVLPEVEIGLKASLLANIKSIVSCSADPRIPKQLRQRSGEYYFDKLKYQFSEYTGKPKVDKQRGMLIDCDSIDPEGILAYSPYSDKGMNNYFGVINDEMRLFYKNLGVNDSTRFGTVENADGSTSIQRVGNVSNMKSKWELCRADDRNAFIWFVIHVAKFPSPTPVKIKGQVVTIDGKDFIDEMGQEGGKTSLFAPLNLNLVSSGSSTMSVGSTIINESNPNEISLCIGADFEDEDDNYTGETRVIRNQFIPVSSNWNSADWYVDKSQYYNYNLGYKTNKPIADYVNQKPICNLQFMSPTDYQTDYVGGSTQKINLTILPKPYVYIPYIDTGEPIWRWKRILFDAYGNPDPNGIFSLPTEKMTKGNRPYVHNDNVSAIGEAQHIQDALKEINDDEYANIALMVYFETTDGKPGEKSMNAVKKALIDKYKTSLKMKALVMAFSAWTPEKVNGVDMEALKVKTVNVLNECYQTLVAQEGGGSANSPYVELKVGEDEDKCSLFISKETGEYFLAETGHPNNREGDYTKHLIQCYNGLTVYEFNYDYIMGMRLFSPKVVCAKLLDAATNPSYNSTFKIGINKIHDQNEYDYFGNKQRITEIVRKIIETEDTELTDCFFTFDNNQYASMLQQAEDKRYHQQPYLNDKTDTVDLSDVYDILQNYPENGTKQEQETVLSNAISAATAKVTSNQNVYALQDSKKTKLDFATNMLSQLAAILIQSLLSPKVLMLIAVNKQLMGDGGETFNAEELLNGMKGLVVGIVKELRDLILKKLLDYILDYLGPLAAQLSFKVEKEKFSVYQNILSELLAVLRKGKEYSNRLNSVLQALLSKYGDKNKGKGTDYDLPTVLDNVDYADIIGSPTSEYNTDKPVSNKC